MIADRAGRTLPLWEATQHQPPALLSQPQQQHLSEGLGLHLVLLANTQGRGCHVNFDTEVNVAYALGGSLLQGKRSKS